MKTWWQTRHDLVLRLLAILGSVASLVALVIAFVPSNEPFPWWATVLLALAALSIIGLVVLEVLGQEGVRVYARDDTEGIKRYMHDWIEHGGRVVVWTRDMSWAHNAETEALLKWKASRGELILCLPKSDKLSTELEAAGAEVCAYGTDNLESPSSRFTITFFGRDGARVAVGRANGNSHVIHEFDSAGHPAFCMAEDLVALARTQCARRGNE